jgi:hypothetical protein
MPSRFQIYCNKAEKKLNEKERASKEVKERSVQGDLLKVAFTTTVVLLSMSAMYMVYVWAAARASI